jgi:hypothetical protein
MVMADGWMDRKAAVIAAQLLACSVARLQVSFLLIR